MKRTIIYSTTLVIIIGVLAVFFTRDWCRAQSDTTVLANSAGLSADSNFLVVAPGRVEPVSEEIRIGSQITGKIKDVLVEEGDRVRKGQVIVVLENRDYKARVVSAEARLHQAEAELRRILNGARSQERLEALAAVKENEAVLENARMEKDRRQALYRDGLLAREEADRWERQYQVANARYDASVQRHALINDEAREEDRAKAKANLALAQAQLDEARALLEKTIIRSPIDGVVLRKHLKAGESVISDSANMSIVTVADAATLRVRADVDETEVRKIRPGQKAYVTAQAYGDQKFWGRIVRISLILGKKNVRTDEPTERADTKILETLIELEPGSELPLGLRVNAFILGDDDTVSHLSSKNPRIFQRANSLFFPAPV